MLVFSGFRLILFIYLWQQVEGSSPAAAPSDDSPSSIPARCSQERRDEEERGESRKISPRGLERRQGTAGGCWGKAGCGEQPPAPSAPVCPRVHACDMIYYPSAARRRAAQPRWWGRGIKGGGPGCPERCGAPTPSTPPARGPLCHPVLGDRRRGGHRAHPGCRRSQRAVGTRTHACVHTSTPTCVFGCTHRRIHTHTRLHVHTHRRAVYVQGHTHAVITYVQEICMHRCAGRGTGTHLGRGKGICIHLYTRRGCAHTVIHMQGY